MMYSGNYPKTTSYNSYKNEQFAKKLEKMRNLINSVHETSLKDEDKKLLINKIKDLL